MRPALAPLLSGGTRIYSFYSDGGRYRHVISFAQKLKWSQWEFGDSEDDIIVIAYSIHEAKVGVFITILLYSFIFLSKSIVII